MEKIYIWYSGATDITGKNLVEGLKERLDSDQFEVSGGTSKPEDVNTVICYGTKTSEDMEFSSGVKVLNHPNNIRINRNKLKALNKMLAHEVNVPYFSELPDACTDEVIAYPVVARTNYHQGGRGLAICTSQEQVRDLMGIDQVGFGYIQEFVPFKQEYRIHIFNNKVIKCAVKVPQRDPIMSWKAAYMEKIERSMLRNSIELNKETADICLKTIVKDLTLPDLLVKSNKKGWCFSHVSVDNVKLNLIEMAKKAVKTLGLDFGAVDCALDYDEKPWVIEVNTGPGLQGRTLTSYLGILEAYIKTSVAETGSISTNPTQPPSNDISDIQNEMAQFMNTMNEMTLKMTEMSQKLLNR